MTYYFLEQIQTGLTKFNERLDFYSDMYRMFTRYEIPRYLSNNKYIHLTWFDLSVRARVLLLEKSIEE